jgi:ssDNA-binding Zn-finger/Zn-ribbon topoisomerase 1
MSCWNCGKTITKLGHIIIGTTKYLFDIDFNDESVKNRLIACSNCPNSKPLIKINNKTTYGCTVCNCIIQSKVRVKEEKCPINKW